MVKKLKSELKQIILDNTKGYILVLGVFIAGMALSYILNVTSGLESEIKLYINDFISGVKNYNTDSDTTFSLAMMGYIKGICILLLMSLSLLGSAGTLVFIFIKGFSFGIVIISMFNILGYKAALLFLCLILPHSIILVPCFLTYSLFCMKNAYSVCKGVKDLKTRVIMPILYGILSVAFLSIASLIQAYVEPLLIRMIF